MRTVRRAALVLVVAAGCGGSDRRPPAPPQSPPAAVPLDAALASADAAAAPATPAPPAASATAAGVGHFAAIIATAIARHGDAALSIDAAGGVRLWTALDGSAPPRPLATAGLLEPRIERSGDDVVVGGVLPGGVGYLAVHHPTAAPSEITIDAAGGDVLAVVPTVDARAAVVVRADQALELVALDGTVRARVELGRERVRAVSAIGADGVLAVLRTADDRYVARRYRVRAGELTAAADVPLPHPPIDGRPIAVSPDGTRLATFYPQPPLAAPGPPKPVPDESPPPPPHALLQVVELATGKDVTPAALAGEDFDLSPTLAFSASDRLHVSANNGVATFSLPDGTRGQDLDGVGGRFAAGDGVVIEGVLVSLLVARDGKPPVYLGYRLTAPRAIALSPDGRRLAGVGFDGLLAIETLDGSAPARVIPVATGAQPIFVGFLDDARVLVVDEGHHALVYDVATGEQRQLAVVPDGRVLALHPRRTWLFAVRDGGGFWAMRLDPTAAQPLGAPVTVDDRSVLLAPIDGDPAGPVLATLGNGDLLTYGADDLASAATARKRKRARVPGPSMTGGDELGRFYVARGTTVQTVDVAGTTSSVTLPLQAEGLWPLPGGGFLVSTAAAGGVTAYGLDGTARWSLGVGTNVNGLATSADRTQLAVWTVGGVLIVDPATGERRAARCGLAFGAWPERVADVFGGVPAVCP